MATREKINSDKYTVFDENLLLSNSHFETSEETVSFTSLSNILTFLNKYNLFQEI